jgi:uncharacterized protein (TIGR01777 family)
VTTISNKRVVLAGGNGFLGRALSQELLRLGYEPVVLTRAPSTDPGSVQHLSWDGKSLGESAQSLDGARAVVNLVGKSVDCRPTEKNRREIVASRVDSVNVIARAISQCDDPPKAWVQASSLAIYGDAGDRICDEDAPLGDGFGADVCKRWEAAFGAARMPGTRKVVLRIGAVLAPEGVAMRKLLVLTKCFLGGTVGSGRQWISWLHLSDMTRMFLWAIERDEIEGVFHATSPNAVTNRELMRELRRALRRPWSPPTPAWAVRIGAKLIGTDAEIPLTGRRCLPKRFLEAGFEFEHPDLDETLASVLPRGRV